MRSQSVTVSRTTLGLLAHSSARLCRLSIRSARASALHYFPLSSRSWSVLDTEPGSLPPAPTPTVVDH